MRGKFITVSSVLALLFACFLTGTPSAEAQDSSAPSGEEAITPFLLPDAGPFEPKSLGEQNTAAITAWLKGGHADATAEAFTHWDDEGAVPPNCSVCHAGAGFRSFHGLDGSEPGLPEAPIPAGGVVDCETCHNDGLASISELTLPSGVVHPVVGVEAACMTCHQGRAAGVTVENATASKPDDTVDAELRFVNPHYATAAASWLGGYGGAGYHYPGKTYSGRFFHARPVASCVSCHNPHSLEVKVETCATCHDAETPEAIRIRKQSYDGSGNLSVGIRSDIAANAQLLMETLVTYTGEVAGTALVFEPHYPYFFADANGDGVADQVDGSSVNYAAWTPRSLKAAYNWKLVTADPGIYAHNPHYALELLYDSIEDLAGATDSVDFDSLNILR
ncbi:Class III cytochrome C family protein [Pseudooceanicola marinus]|uniref:Class III cytochrome C family protein n=1 Tax=Pseudooceanicola marinus TaxID=396013 RepID=A0A1X6ZCK3_9RHOB|nr:cytochrome c3 family protein [Pseudooceanicola marinus]PJE28311.1 cytochrome C [Pseudooceanicola marinus]SLN47685.1 Class III cytochrome C family protein [Pseudooceanicola marinus]